MSGAIKLTFQPLPNVPFLQGWPGIVGHEPWRKAPAVQGLLEVRPGNHQVKARHIQIELVRIETLPGGQSGLTTVGSPVTVWQCAQGKEWDFLQPADYKFYIPLPLSIPGSVELKVKGGGIRYELVANLAHKPKSGLLRRDSNPITKVQQPIFITKHELHSAWPVYNIPETRSAIAEQLELTVNRNYTAFGPSDRIEVMASLRSSRPKPLKLRSFLLQLIEVTTIRPPTAKGGKANPVIRTRVVHEAKTPVGEKIARGEDKKRTVALVIPAGLVASTTTGARLFDLTYELSVTAIMEGTGDVKVEHMQSTLGIYGRPRAHDVIGQIGVVEALCPGRSAIMRSDSQATSNRSSIGGPPSSSFPQHGFIPFPEPRQMPPRSQAPVARHSMYGQPALYQQPMGSPNPGLLESPSQRRLSVQPFSSRTLSADSSSLYSHPQMQSQSDVSSVREVAPPRHPHTLGLYPPLDPQSSPNVYDETKRLSWTPVNERNQYLANASPSASSSPRRTPLPGQIMRTHTGGSGSISGPGSTLAEEGRRNLDVRPVSVV